MRSTVSSQGDTASVISSQPSVKAASTVVSSHLIVSDSGGCKRKFSSIAEAISDSDEDIDDEISAKRPRTPVVVNNPQHEKFSSLWEKWKVLKKIFSWMIGLAVVIFFIVFIYTLVTNIRCDNLR